MSAAQNRRLYEEALGYLDEADHRQPSLTLVYNIRAKLYFLAQSLGLGADGYENAIAELHKALKANPLDLDARTGLADIYMKQGEMRKALAVLEDGLRWPRPKGQSDLEFLVATARLRNSIGDAEGYKQLIDEALARAKSYGLTKPANQK